MTRGLFAVVDDEDYEWLSQWKWFAQACPDDGFYAKRNECVSVRPRKYKAVFMHHYIMGKTMVDHANRNRLDNRRCNLREATFSQNTANHQLRSDNKHGYKGVCRLPNGKWMARAGGKPVVYLGTFETKVAAAIAYNIEAVRMFGEFACLNPIFSGEVA